MYLDSTLSSFLEAYICENFEACANTELFPKWRLHWLSSVLWRDDLKSNSEEVVLRAILKWHGSDHSRDDAAAALLAMARFALLSVPSLTALSRNANMTGLLGVVVARLCQEALLAHCGPPRKRALVPATRVLPKLRNSYIVVFVASAARCVKPSLLLVTVVLLQGIILAMRKVRRDQQSSEREM